MWRTGEIEAQVEVESREPGSGQDVDEEGKRRSLVQGRGEGAMESLLWSSGIFEPLM